MCIDLMNTVLFIHIRNRIHNQINILSHFQRPHKHNETDIYLHSMNWQYINPIRLISFRTYVFNISLIFSLKSNVYRVSFSVNTKGVGYVSDTFGHELDKPKLKKINIAIITINIELYIMY